MLWISEVVVTAAWRDIMVGATIATISVVVTFALGFVCGRLT